MANVLADSVSRLRAVSLYHDFDVKHHQQEFSVPFEPLSPVEPMNICHSRWMKFSLHLILKDSHRYMMQYMTYPLDQTNDDVKLSLENVSPTDTAQLEQNLISLLELTSEKVTKLQKNDTFCKKHNTTHILQQIQQLLYRCHRWLS